MTESYPHSGERLKLISELLMAFKRLLPKYEGIERKRLESRIKEMERWKEEINGKNSNRTLLQG